ncbi:MAG TPA: HIT family protein [Alphaproteobacteria bacterium]|nr:HIT family protein [Alphaproteobacteria bacterium]HAJ48229.1 HIT family protein [Alphaproteobacteria bacterium]
MTYAANNIFAKIIRGEAPCAKVYEDAHALAFMDIMPTTEGHTLVIPKEPAESLFDLSASGAQHLIVTTQKVAQAVKKAFDAPGIMLMQLNGAAAGQSVFHIHFHIIPRRAGLDITIHGRTMADRKVLEKHASQIRALL